MHGTREWSDYQVTAQMTPHMCRAGGIGVRVQGMQRYYALLLDTTGARLIRAFEGHDTILAQADTGWSFGVPCELRLQVQGSRLRGFVNGALVVEADDPQHLFTSGAIALIAEEGRIGCDLVMVGPLEH